MSLKEIIKSGIPMLGAALTDEKLSKLELYYEVLTEYNAKFNLTAIKGEDEAARLHFLDSIAILSATEFIGKSVIDIGTGAGFPGIPLKVCEETIELTLVDSTEKKVHFLETVCGKLNIEASCLHARAEELGQYMDYRESYDIAVSRAVAELRILSELCLPLVKSGGNFIAMKGIDSDEEIKASENAIKTLGGDISEIYEYIIPGTEIRRRAIKIKKVKETDGKYPRHYGVIKKKPL